MSATTVWTDRVPTADVATTRTHAIAMLTRDKRLMTFALVGQIISAALATTVPYFVGQLVGGAAQGESRSQLFTTGGIALVLALLAAGSVFITQRWTVVLVQRAVAQLRSDVLRAITRLPLAAVEATGTGDLVSRTTRDVGSLTRFSMMALPSLATTFGMLVLTVVAAPFAGGWVSLGFLIVMPWVYVVYMRHFKRSRPGYVRAVKAEARADAHLNETVEAVGVVDALGLGEVRRRQYLDRLRTAYKAEDYVRRLRYVFFPTPTSAMYVGTITSLLWGVFLVQRGHADIAQVTAVTLYAVSLAPQLTMAGFLLDDAQLAESALARLVGVLGVPSGEPENPQTPTSHEVRADHVDFAYRTANVLSDVSLVIPQGQRVVIVGPSGSGKSTLARLFTGVVTPTRGSVTLGGVPVGELSQDTAHQHIMMLTQEYHVFEGTLRRNLALAAPNATDEQLWEAIRTVGADRWARSLPDGLDTIVSTGDHRLSPGHAQEIALARVVLANPPVVILDEATSLLDGDSAASIEQAIDRALAGRTVIAIAHRLGVAARSDRVIVVADGQIVEDGTHDELRRAGGRYATLWESWSHGRDSTS